MSNRGIALTALGMVNALGVSSEDIWKRILNGDQSGLSLQEGYLWDRAVRVGKLTASLPEFPTDLKRYACRNNALSMAAFQSIAEAVRNAVAQYGATRIGVVMGSSTAGIASTEEAFRVWSETQAVPASFDYVQQEMGGVSEFVAALADAQGPAYTISTACSSSAKVFASGRALLRSGVCDAVIVGGADSLCRLTVQGFSALETISDEPCNSMSRHRKGFNIGEGAALFLMEHGDRGVQLLGVGESSDAYHMSAPDPEGKGAQLAMERALVNASLVPSAVDYIHLHGTGTILNDQMESRAVNNLFTDVPASSSKGMLGHTLGASGAMGIGLCWWALNASGDLPLPPHCWDGANDPALPALHLVQKGETLRRKSSMIFLNNAFGFGGSNCSVILGIGA